jgi:hypothetical protein
MGRPEHQSRRRDRAGGSQGGRKRWREGGGIGEAWRAAVCSVRWLVGWLGLGVPLPLFSGRGAAALVLVMAASCKSINQ